MKLLHSSKVLVVGPLAAGRNPELQDRLPLDLRLRLLTWSLIGVIFGVALWFWVRPVWRDLETLRQTARDLGVDPRTVFRFLEKEGDKPDGV